MKEAMMESTPLFATLTEEQRTVIADRMVLESRRAGDIIYQQGTPATAMYLVRSGWARLVTDQFAVLANLGAGSLLGDADTVSGRNYSTSAEAATELSLWALRAADLKAIMEANPAIARSLKSAFGISEDQALERHLRRLELMAGLAPEALRDISGHLHPQQFKAGQVVYEQGTEGDSLFVIDEGKVEVQAGGAVIANTGRGETFGEGAFLTGEPRSTTVTAVTDVDAWSLSRSEFEELALRYPALALNLSRLVTRRLRERNLRASARVAVVPAAVPVAAPSPQPAPQPQPVQPATPAVTGSLTGLSRASDSASSWWGSHSTGAKIRVIAVVVLLIWLLGVAAPWVILSLTGRGAAETHSQVLNPGGFSQRAVLVAMAADLPVDVTPTFTPWPTETPIPTATFTPTATPTNTPIPTATFTPTNTPVPPTNTPVPPTATPRPVVRVQAAAPAAAVAAAAPAAAAPKAAPAPTVQFKLAEVRRLSPCENRGNHHIFIKVVDGAGNPVDGVVVVQSPSGVYGNVVDKNVTGSKGPGLAEFTMWKGAEYSVYVSGDGANPGNTEIANSLHSAFTDEAVCESGGGGNTLFHNSFSVIFIKNF